MDEKQIKANKKEEDRNVNVETITENGIYNIIFSVNSKNCPTHIFDENTGKILDIIEIEQNYIEWDKSKDNESDYFERAKIKWYGQIWVSKKEEINKEIKQMINRIKKVVDYFENKEIINDKKVISF